MRKQKEESRLWSRGFKRETYNIRVIYIYIYVGMSEIHRICYKSIENECAYIEGGFSECLLIVIIGCK